MKALTNFIVDDLNLDTIIEAATKKAPKQEKWPNNVDAANKKADELLSQATDVDDIDVTKVVKGKETKNSWAVEPPNPNWEKEIADFDPEDYETKKNDYTLSYRFENGRDFLVLGEAGWAKTASIMKWAKKFGWTTLTVYLDKAVATDLGGIPVPAKSAETGALYMNYSHPGWLLYMEEHPKEKFFLFFDEMNQAAPEVLNALMPIVLTHTICGVSFGDRMMVGAAGNLTSENSGVMDIKTECKPLYARFKPVIKWKTHGETWETVFEYFHDKYDDTIKPIIDKMEAIADYWSSPRDLERVLFNMVEKGVLKTKSGKKAHSAVYWIKEEFLPEIEWDELSDDIKESKKYQQTLDDLAEYISKFIKSGGDPDSLDAPKKGNALNATEQSIASALAGGRLVVDGAEYMCTVENVLRDVFDPKETGVNAEGLRRIIKIMKAGGKKPMFQTNEEALPIAKKKKWIDPATVQGFLINKKLDTPIDSETSEKPARRNRRSTRD